MKRVILTLRDITERRRLDDVRARLAAIVESSEDSIISKDRNGIVTSWNRGSEKLFGYTEEEMLGQSIRKLIPADRQNEEDEILARIHNGQTVEHFETERMRKDGTIVHVSLMISPIHDANGDVVGASKITRDITERVRLERQLRQSQKMEAVGLLTGGIAHDFNNLLGVVIGNLDLLERNCQGDEIKLKRIRTAVKAASRGADLTRRLLAFSSKDELRPSSAVLEESIQSMIELASRLLGAEIRVVTHFDTTLPPIHVDSNGLEGALLNLVVNSRDAMPNGGVLTFSTGRQQFDDEHPGVQSGEISPGDFIRISVTDTGTGMTREQLDRAFEPFYTTKGQGKGTGLGLAMVYGFAKQSGGLARIYSEVGRGTTVSLYLPFAKGISKPPVKKSTVRGAPLDSAYKVLVVDDESDLLEIALSYLSELGYHGLKAKDAMSALAIVLDRGDIDVLVTDISMPGGMNGVELAREVKRISPKVKVVYCSGFPAETLADRNRSPVDGPLLHKPYQRSEFAAMILHVLEGSLPA
jgi:PAS domain S-box-containing protein